MISAVVCNCGDIFDHKGEIEWHRTTKGHIWNKIKKEMDGNYIYIKKKIPGNAKCDTCNQAPKKGKWAPICFVVSNKNKLTVRCKKCKKEKLDLIKLQFRELLSKRP